MEAMPVVFMLALTAWSCAAMPMTHSLHVENMKQVNADLIPKVASNLGLTELVKGVEAAGLKDMLVSPGPFTVFGPTNDAFANLPEPVKKAIANVTVLREVLKFHVLSGKLESKDIENELLLLTVLGEGVRLNTYTVAGKPVVTAQCAKINLTRVDKAASNGVIHVLESVMIPPAGSIFQVLAANGDYKTLVKAVTAAGLVDTLNRTGPFTVFAPTDKAFGKLPSGTLEKLLKNPAQLKRILTYHVVSGTLCSSGLSTGKVTTVEGQDVEVKVSSVGVVVNKSKVTTADISVENGVVHAIDTVLLPPNFQLP